MKPLLVVSFQADPADALRAYQALRGMFRCELEAVGLYDVEIHEPNETDLREGFDLRTAQGAKNAFRQISMEAQAEIVKAEARGVLPTIAGRHAGRPNPNEFAAYVRLAAMLLREDPAGVEQEKRLAASKIVPVFDAVLQEEGLIDLLVGTSRTRKLYSALRDCVPGIQIVPDSNGGRMYFMGVDWSEEAVHRFHPPKFKGPYS